MDWKETLSKAGHRISSARKHIMNVLEASHVAQTPMQIHQTLTEQGHALGLVSVYRNLELLLEYDLVCVVYGPDGSTGYIAGETGHHHHIVCQDCHRTVAFEGSEDLSELITMVEAQTQFDVRDHFLQLYGLCQDCQEKHE